MTQCPLRNVVIVDVDIALQGLHRVFPGTEAAGRQDLADAAVAALDHAVGLGMSRRDDAVLDVPFGTDPVEAMLARRFPFAGGAEPVGEFLAVICQDLGDLEGGGLEGVRQEALGTGGGLLRENLDIDPTGGAFAGGKEVAGDGPRRLSAAGT